MVCFAFILVILVFAHYLFIFFTCTNILKLLCFLKLVTFHRSGSSSAINGSNKLDGNPLPAGSFARTMLKNGQEKAILMRDFTAGSNKDKVLAKGNNKYVFYAFRLLILKMRQTWSIADTFLLKSSFIYFLVAWMV